MKKVFFIQAIWILLAGCGGSPTDGAKNSQETQECGGSGTVVDPYLICNKSSLDKIALFPSARFSITTDIVVNGSLPQVGTFTGAIYGNNHKLINVSLSSVWVVQNNWIIQDIVFENLRIDSTDQRVALIQKNNESVQNISIENGTIIARSAAATEVAGIVAINTGSITNSSFQGSISAPNTIETAYSSIGGIAGWLKKESTYTPMVVLSGTLSGSTISGNLNAYSVGGVVGLIGPDGRASETFNYALVTGGFAVGGIAGIVNDGSASGLNVGAVQSTTALSAVGGIVGVSSSGQVSLSASSGTISGKFITGGLVGNQTGAASYLTYSFSLGTVQTSDAAGSIGGLVGKSDAGTTEECHSLAQVGSTGFYRGKLVGERTGGTFAKLYYSTSSVGPAGPVGSGATTGIIGITTTQFATQSNFTGWNFTTRWAMGTGGYPVLR